MSLVNDMLRDLEARRAAPGERPQLDGLQAVDERAAARRAWRRRGLRGLAVLVLVATVAGAWALQSGGLRPAPEPAPAPAPAPRLLEVLPQHDSRGLVLQLLLDRSVVYRRTEERGSVSLSLPGVRWAGEVERGRVQGQGRSLFWQVEQQGDAVQVLLVGLSDELRVLDRLEATGERWQLWLEVPFGEVASMVDSVELDDLPVAEAAEPGSLPDWLEAPVTPAATPAVPAARAKAEAEAEAEAEAKMRRSAAEPVLKPEVSIAPHRPDALSEARALLERGDKAGAIAQLEALAEQRGEDPQVLRWLARAYLADGRQQRLLDWLPTQLQRQPHDSELRLLLARSQLQAAEPRTAVATLEAFAPPLAQQPSYHALLAASYQQTEQWPQSAALYRRLLELSPAQATWQLGLAIALEQQDRPAEAGRHYRLALQGAGLDDSARQFARERAAVLGESP